MNLLFIDGEQPLETQDELTQGVEGAASNDDLSIGDDAGTTAPVAEPEPTFLQEYGMWFLILGMIVIMYFFMWRPESKRRKQMQQFRDGLKKGDKIITAGGIYGVIKEVHPTSLLIEVDSNVTLRIDKNMVVGDPQQGIQQ